MIICGYGTGAGAAVINGRVPYRATCIGGHGEGGGNGTPLF